MQFPLYDDLSIKSKSIKYELNDSINITISTKLTREDTDNIYLLILHHYVLSNNLISLEDMKNICKPVQKNRTKVEHKKIYSLPFGGVTQQGGRGASYNISSLPDNLKDIIACYINLTVL